MGPEAFTVPYFLSNQSWFFFIKSIRRKAKLWLNVYLLLLVSSLQAVIRRKYIVVFRITISRSTEFPYQKVIPKKGKVHVLKFSWQKCNLFIFVKQKVEIANFSNKNAALANVSTCTQFRQNWSCYKIAYARVARIPALMATASRTTSATLVVLQTFIQCNFFLRICVGVWS